MGTSFRPWNQTSTPRETMRRGSREKTVIQEIPPLKRGKWGA